MSCLLALTRGADTLTCLDISHTKTTRAVLISALRQTPNIAELDVSHTRVDWAVLHDLGEPECLNSEVGNPKFTIKTTVLKYVKCNVCCYLVRCVVQYSSMMYCFFEV